MKSVKHLAVVVVGLGFGLQAFAGNNPRIDEALKESLVEKKALNMEFRKNEVPVARGQVNQRYRSVEVLEMGDELGGFASSKSGLAKEATKPVEDVSSF